MCSCVNSKVLFAGVLTLCGVVLNVLAFNVDTVNYVRHRGQPDSMFGFSVATHRERGNSWILVGAPEGQSDLTSVDHGGVVFRCSTTNDNSCQELPFDTAGNNVDKTGKVMDQKSRQWFGATVNTAGAESPIVACAPRYVWFSNQLNRKEPVGTCYVAASDFSDYSEYSPCRTRFWGYHRQGSCQAGLGAAISKKGNRLFIGAPGSWYWQGQMYSIDSRARFPYSPPIFSQFGAGQVFKQSLESRPTVVSTHEGSAVDDDSYMGYSVAVGDFTGEGDQGVAVGMPRGASLQGKVILYTWNLTNHQNITGQQLGSYFGYAIAVNDVDGDGQDDLIIGSPLYTESNNEGKYEVGRTYVVYQGKSGGEGRFRKLHTLDGTNSKGRFGLSVASLGDINLDGFGDFAVGAPYDGANGRGAVYIYHGSASGVREKYSQVILAEDMGVTTHGTFGFSIAGGIDLDQNDYPDMAVGSYLDNSAVFLRARPVVKILAFVRYMTFNKQISLEEKNCTLKNFQKVPCTSIDFCVKFNGIGVPQAIDLDLQFLLDSKKSKDPRMYFLSDENKNTLNETWVIKKDSPEQCQTKFVYIKNDIRDKLTSLDAEIRYSMREKRSANFGPKGGKAPLAPILDLNMPTVRKDSISVQKNCGPDNICIPDLEIIAKPNVKKYLLGSNERLEIDVIVKNKGEDSFESTFNLKVPPGVNFKKVIEDDKPEIRVHCPNVINNTIKCDIGNPLPREKIVHFKILLDPYHKEGMRPSYDFYMEVNSTNPEEVGNTRDNQKAMSINIWVDSELSLEGSSTPPEVHYNASHYSSETIKHESEIGPQIVYKYVVRNNGPSNINEADVYIIWPFATLAEEDLLYLLEQPETTGPIQCETAHANPRNYELDYRKKSYLESSGVAGSAGELTSSYGKGSVTIEEKTSGSSSGITSTSTSWQSRKGEKHKSAGKNAGHKKYNADDFEDDSGDGSLIHLNRRKEFEAAGGAAAAAGGGGGSQHVQVTEARGSDGKSGKHYSSSWNSSSVSGGPVVTHTWSKNTTSYTGPDGVTHYSESTYGGAGGSRVTGSGTASGGGSSATGSGGSGRTAIIYSSSGSKQGQDARNRQWGGGEASSTQTSSNSSQTQHGGRTYTSGGQITAGATQYGHESQGSGGSVTHVEGSYPGSPIRNSGTSKYHTWDERNRQHANRNREEQIAYEDARRRQQGYGTHDEDRRVHGHRETYGHHDEHRVESGRNYEETGRGQYDRTKFTSGVEEESSSNATSGNRITWTTDSQGNIVSTTNQQSGGSQQSGGHKQTTGSQSTKKEEDEEDEYDYYDESEEQHGGHSSERTETQTQSSTGGRDRSTYGKYDQTQGGRINYENTGIGAAALGGGFKTTALDLGPLGNSNVDEELSKHSDSRFGQENAGHRATGTRTRYDPDLGTTYEERVYSSGGGYGAQDGNQGARTFSGGSSRTYSTSREDTGSRNQGSGETGDYGTRSGSRGSSGSGRSSDGSSSHYESRSESYSSGGSSSSSHGGQHSRQKRQLSDGLDDLELKQSLRCNATRCLTLHCKVGPLKKDEEAWIALRSRVNARTLRNISWSKPITLSTMMLARISKLPYIGTPIERPIHSHEVFTTVSSPDTELRPDVVPLWVVVLSACAGAIILLLLIFLLYKCGFFKRNRPSDIPERQPLNRNGHYQNGDEQL